MEIMTLILIFENDHVQEIIEEQMLKKEDKTIIYIWETKDNENDKDEADRSCTFFVTIYFAMEIEIQIWKEAENKIGRVFKNNRHK